MSVENGEKTKLLEAPKSTERNMNNLPNHVIVLIRAVFALIFFITGFNFSNSAFFKEYPLFGLNYLAQILISMLAGVVGFFIVPEILFNARNAIENLIRNTVAEIVSSFWEQQSKRIQEQRRDKQRKKSENEKKKLEEEMKNAIVLDTSVLIDGRIVDIVKLQFLDNPFVIPQAVIDELHSLSDSKDNLKRQKGRRGLDMIKDLKKRSKIMIVDTGNKNRDQGVDKILVEFAKENNFKLMTMDFNLNKVASVSGVKALNINDLANSLKTILLPGEELQINILHEGKERNQGVGYLEDGTMIVVENAKDKIGEEVKVKVSKMIQSPAGKIIFCTLS
ncbi:TRAM domain-containing protein [candidate division WWE3 bacterium]|jgi:uncharacterized protein YacL|uniref:TRAM domain-containing protein n=1 Tax=candidate division WWE3 bacterium TaxID=2053526 RepID=A0A3A4ZD50_UNCKA|nr:MAG: TRAM domain-containing protein [candidate division WWE3 bacterium]